MKKHYLLLTLSSLFVIFVFFFFIRVNHILSPEVFIEAPIVENENSDNDLDVDIIIPEKKDFKILFFGDMMLDRNVGALINKNGVDSIFSYLKETEFTKDFDIVFTNLEGAVTNEGKHYPPVNLYDFAFKPEHVLELKKYNFNFFTLANNHLADQGSQGIDETYQNLTDMGYLYLGCQDAKLAYKEDNIPSFSLNKKNETLLSQDNCSLALVESGDLKIAFLAFSIVYTNIEQERILEAVKLANELSDFVVVSPHWGLEYKPEASLSQTNLAHKMIDSGADIIIGHHPHVIQNFEMYNDKAIFYSLGNFVFDQYFSKETQEGLAVSLTIKDDSSYEVDYYLLESSLSSIKNIEYVDNLSTLE